MTQTDDHSEELPRALLGAGDAEMLANVLEGYIGYTRRTVPPSKKRDEEISLLERVRRHLALLQCSKVVQVTIPLSLEELAALEHAMGVFVKLVRKNVARSQERDHALSCIDALRQAIARIRCESQN
jgi:hypothetical protein